MKKFKLLAMAATALFMLGSCSDEKVGEGVENKFPDIDVNDGVYFEICFDLPTASRGSRSQTGNPEDDYTTSTEGVEVGKDYENTVNDVLVVLAGPTNTADPSQSYSFIAASQVNAANLSSLKADNSSYRALSKFSKTELAAYYGEEGTIENATATVFVFCNPTKAMNQVIFGDPNNTEDNGAQLGDTEWINKIGNLTSSSPIWSNNSFLMSNATIATRSLPSTFAGWNNYTTREKPFDLSGLNPEVEVDNETGRGPVRVERAAARFDFRDGSEDGINNDEFNGIGNYTYQVMFEESIDEEGKNNKIPILNIQLQKMSLVNMNNKYYFLRHVSADGSPTGASICRPERKWSYTDGGTYVPGSGNYVVDADYTWKQETKTAWRDSETGPENGWDFDKHFTYPLFNSDGSIDNTNLVNDRWGTVVLSQVVNHGDEDNPDWGGAAEYGDYKIWRYLTENTIAGVNGEINGISTGIVFKGIMKATDEALNSTNEAVRELAETINSKNLKSNPYENPLLYYFSGTLYPTWPRLRQAAIQAAMPECIWIPAGKNDNGEDVEGHYELSSINRSNSTYAAVFGNGGFGTEPLLLPEIDPETNRPTGGSEFYDITDPRDPDDNSANTAWNNWNAAGKPSLGPEKDFFKEKVVGAEITIYQTSNDPSYGIGYYCYYYYWNRHNDNGNDGVMGPMEFAVVRNNVYKLAVVKLSQIGHPRVSENDPNKPTPGTPDESQDVYLTVKTETLPWVVRVNNIVL